MKNIAIIGCGVAGMSAALYALRAGVDVTVFEQYGVGGLVATLTDIENYPALAKADGFELTQSLFAQIKELGVNLVMAKVVAVTEKDGDFVVKTTKETYSFGAVIVATGTSRNKLGFEQQYVGKGVSYCATCDGNFYRKKVTAVAGSGNHAVTEVLYLAGLCAKVYLVCDKEKPDGEEINLEKLNALTNVEVVLSSRVVGLSGEDKLTAVSVADKEGNVSELAVDGLFVAVGASAETGFLSSDFAETKGGYLVADDTMLTTRAGLFCCGDVSDGKLKQIVTACGDGAKAGSYAARYVKRLR